MKKIEQSRPKEDIMYFPQFLASNGIFCTGGYVGR